MALARSRFVLGEVQKPLTEWVDHSELARVLELKSHFHLSLVQVFLGVSNIKDG